MKKLVLVLMALIFSLSIFNCSSIQTKPTEQVKEYTYDGEIDPVEFYTWDIVMSWNCEKGHMHILLSNPDKDSDILAAETMNIPDGNEKMSIVAYRYLKGNVMYFFSFNEETYNYDQWEPKPTDKSKGI